MSKADEMNNQPATKKSKPLYAEFEDQELLKRFRADCALNDRTVKEVTEKLVAGFLAGKFKID